jgi:hypothetical protein
MRRPEVCRDDPDYAEALTMTLPDAYLSVEDAADFVDRVLDVSAWTSATAGQKAAALLEASDQVDSQRFGGQKIAYDQAREFPRIYVDASRPGSRVNMLSDAEDPAGAYVRDYGRQILGMTGGYWDGEVWDWSAANAPCVPDRVKMAVFVQALSLLADASRQARLQDIADGVSGQSAGGISESYREGAKGRVLCEAARRQLDKYLLRTGRIL